jgi:hypothetical protein
VIASLFLERRRHVQDTNINQHESQAKIICKRSVVDGNVNRASRFLNIIMKIKFPGNSKIPKAFGMYIPKIN